MFKHKNKPPVTAERSFPEDLSDLVLLDAE